MNSTHVRAATALTGALLAGALVGGCVSKSDTSSSTDCDNDTCKVTLSGSGAAADDVFGHKLSVSDVTDDAATVHVGSDKGSAREGQSVEVGSYRVQVVDAASKDHQVTVEVTRR
ncbi:hypothetical protein ACFQVC_06930 [Streptomyces monticola]|uniref:Uncharacterized protein n=1 Tax=Streptomyces monticola TaxID=2666263 RepID=A0ABW2JE14_9ACTN